MALSARIYDALDVLNACRHKFEGIFSLHGVRTGSPEDVPGFVDKLLNDRNFAMDFWGLVRSLEAMGDRISGRKIQRTLVDCLCGEWLPNDDPAMAVISRVFDERIGERMDSVQLPEEVVVRNESPATKWGPQMVEARFEPVDEPIVEPAPESMVERFSMIEVEAVSQEFVAEAVPEVEPNEFAVSMEATPAWQERTVVEEERPVVEVRNVGTSSAEHIDQVLSRLELINLELKLHLDDIDSRVSRLEPHIEELKSQVVRSLSMAASVEASVRAVPTAPAPAVEPQWVSEESPAPVHVAAPEPRARVRDYVGPGLDWAKNVHVSKASVGTAVGVAACLALIIWLWGRPPVGPSQAAPVAVSSAAVVTAPAEAAKVPSASAVKAEVQAEVEAAISKAAAPNEDDATGAAADTTAKTPAKGSAKPHGAIKDDLVAPPWTKWYDNASPGGGKAGKVAKVDAEAGAKSDGK